MRVPLTILLIACTAFGQGLWEQRAPLPRAATEVSSAFLNGHIYTVCGLTASGSSSEMFAYDVRRDEWRSVSPAPLQGGGDHCNFAAAAGKLYLVGAIRIGSSFIDGNTYEYDPASDRWQTVARMNVPRGASGVAVINDRIYVAGGLAVSGSTNVFEVFDPATRTWTTLPNMPNARDHLTAQAVGGRLYAIAGRATGDYTFNEEFDPATNMWRSRAQAPTARGGLGSGVIDGRIIVFGGEGNSGTPQNTFRQTEEYDPISDTWRPLAPMPTPRHGLYGVAVDNRIFTPGGGPVAGASFSSANEVFYPSSSQPPSLGAAGIVNAASFAADALAPGAFTSIFGSRLSNGEAVAMRSPLPARLNAVEVRINGQPAPLVYVSPGQINFLVPENISVGPGTIMVTNAGAESSPASVNIRAVAPGIFGVIQRGNAVEIYLTGAAGQTTASVTIGSTPAEVFFFGSTAFIGVQQINAFIPAGVRGPSIPVTVRVGEAASNTVMVRLD